MAAKRSKRSSKQELAENTVDDRKKIPALAAVLIVTAIIYANSLGNGFIYFDDPELVLDNYFIRQFTWENIVHFFNTPVQMTYLPIALITYAVDYQIGQLEPFIYHFSNLVFHLCNVVLVYWFFHLLTRKFKVAIFIAALFAIHPVNVDSVAWIATRNNLLTTLFYLLSLIFYLYYIKRDYKIGYLVLSCLAFILSGLSKSSSVVLPLALLLLDYYYDRKWDGRLLLEKIPFLLVSLFLGIMTLNIRNDVVLPVDYNLLDRFFIFTYSLVSYFGRLLFPFGLSMSYAYPQKDAGLLPFYFYLTPIILGLIIWGLYKLGVTKKVLIIGLSFFVMNIYLSQSVLLIDNFMSNRYAYLSYLGLFFILAEINGQILNASSGWKLSIKNGWWVATVVFALAFSFLTFDRNFVWKDTISLFDDVIAKQPGIPWVYSNRGVAKYRNGDFEGAFQDFNSSLELDPNFALSVYYRGILYHEAGNFDAALVDLDQTVVLVPDFASGYNERGKLKRALQDNQGAMEDFNMAIEIDPYFVDAYFGRANLKYDTGDFQGAIADYSAVISYGPPDATAHYDRGLAESELGDYPSAIEDFTRAIEIDPGFAYAFYMRSIAKANLGDATGSCEDFKSAVSLGYQPSDQEAGLCP